MKLNSEDCALLKDRIRQVALALQRELDDTRYEKLSSWFRWCVLRCMDELYKNRRGGAEQGDCPAHEYSALLSEVFHSSWVEQVFSGGFFHKDSRMRACVIRLSGILSTVDMGFQELQARVPHVWEEVLQGADGSSSEPRLRCASFEALRSILFHKKGVEWLMSECDPLSIINSAFSDDSAFVREEACRFLAAYCIACRTFGVSGEVAERVRDMLMEAIRAAVQLPEDGRIGLGEGGRYSGVKDVESDCRLWSSLSALRILCDDGVHSFSLGDPSTFELWRHFLSKSGNREVGTVSLFHSLELQPVAAEVVLSMSLLRDSPFDDDPLLWHAACDCLRGFFVLDGSAAPQSSNIGSLPRLDPLMETSLSNLAKAIITSPQRRSWGHVLETLSDILSGFHVGEELETALVDVLSLFATDCCNRLTRPPCSSKEAGRCIFQLDRIHRCGHILGRVINTSDTSDRGAVTNELVEGEDEEEKKNYQRGSVREKRIVHRLDTISSRVVACFTSPHLWWWSSLATNRLASDSSAGVDMSWLIRTFPSLRLPCETVVRVCSWFAQLSRILAKTLFSALSPIPKVHLTSESDANQDMRGAGIEFSSLVGGCTSRSNVSEASHCVSLLSEIFSSLFQIMESAETCVSDSGSHHTHGDEDCNFDSIAHEALECVKAVLLVPEACGRATGGDNQYAKENFALTLVNDRWEFVVTALDVLERAVSSLSHPSSGAAACTANNALPLDVWQLLLLSALRSHNALVREKALLCLGQCLTRMWSIKSYRNILNDCLESGLCSLVGRCVVEDSPSVREAMLEMIRVLLESNCGGLARTAMMALLQGEGVTSCLRAAACDADQDVQLAAMKLCGLFARSCLGTLRLEVAVNILHSSQVEGEVYDSLECIYSLLTTTSSTCARKVKLQALEELRLVLDTLHSMDPSSIPRSIEKYVVDMNLLGFIEKGEVKLDQRDHSLLILNDDFPDLVSLEATHDCY